MNWLLEPLRYDFMRTALVAGILIGTAAASLGVYVVLRRMAFIGDALAHSALPGLAGAYLAGINMVLGALGAALLTAIGIGYFSKGRRLSEDTSIGVLFTAMFAAGIILLSHVKSYRCLTHVIFGNILGVTDSDLVVTGLLACLVLATLLAFHKELELTTCDPGYAQSIGFHPDLLRYLLLILLSLTVVCGIQSAGVVLTSALLVTPAATAALITQSVPRMIAIANGVAACSTLFGLYASYYLGVSAGASIVLICTLFFAVAWVFRLHWRERVTVLVPQKVEVRHV